MDPIPLMILALVFAIQAFLLLIIRSGKLKKYSISALLVIFVAWRTKRGKKFIEWLSRAKRFWRYYGNFAIGIVFVCAILMAFTLVWTAIVISTTPAVRKPSPEMLLGLPGVNPIIPLWYGIFAIAIAIVLHEFAHAILSRVGDLKLKSMGILFFIVPVGAFAEPDEEKLMKISKRKRARVFAVGPATNMLVAIVCAFIFSWSMMASLQPREDGVLILSHSKESELSPYGSELGMVVTGVNGTHVKTIAEFDGIVAPPPGTKTTIGIFFKGGNRNVSAFSGVKIATVYSDTPAEKAGLKAGMILCGVKNDTIRNNNDFTISMGRTRAGETVNVTAVSKANGSYSKPAVFRATLDNKYDYTGDGKDRGIGFLGVSAVYLGIYVESVGYISGRLSHPLAGTGSFGDFLDGMRFYISLPVVRLSPVQGALADVYQPTGFWGSVPAGTFWVIANCFYWLFWLNLMLGLTNALPAVPFDGGYIFKDFVDTCFVRSRPGMKKEKREKYVNVVTYSVSFLFIMLILWMFVFTLL